MTRSDADIEAMMRRFTPKQRAKLLRYDHAPWSWFVSQDAYIRLVDEYDRESQKRYWRTLTRVTTYTGPDYRVRAHGQDTWIRATRLQYEQAALLGMQRSIGMPDLTEIPTREIAVA